MNALQKRIRYQGDLKPFLQKVCKDFDIGEYSAHKIVPLGYEDFNLVLKTNKDNYFVKIFGSFRTKNDCTRYIEVVKTVLKSKVSHPLLYKSNQGYLYKISNDGLIDRLCVMQFIKGKTFYELGSFPNQKEIGFIIKQAALINQINIKPPYIYDHWEINNFPKEYEIKNQYLNKEDKNLIEPLKKIFFSLSIEKLPHCFVHGDITKTNIIKSIDNNIYILDFAVANYYPRIQELAILLCDLFFDSKNLQNLSGNYNFVLTEYQKYIKLTEDELKKLPYYIKLAHAMHVLLANYDKVVNKNYTAENEYFLKIGRTGLNYT